MSKVSFHDTGPLMTTQMGNSEVGIPYHDTLMGKTWYWAGSLLLEEFSLLKHHDESLILNNTITWAEIWVKKVIKIHFKCPSNIPFWNIDEFLEKNG